MLRISACFYVTISHMHRRNWLLFCLVMSYTEFNVDTKPIKLQSDNCLEYIGWVVGLRPLSIIFIESFNKLHII